MSQDSKTITLLEGAKIGNAEAIAELLSMHRQRLKRLVQVRLDSRLAARIDASDVVQESLIRASQNLSQYLEVGSLSFYLWLRRITLNHLVDLGRKHLDAERRSVLREAQPARIADASAEMLCNQLASPDSTPSQRVQKEEQRQQIRDAIASLPETDREILVMRTLEQMTVAEVAEALGVSAGAVRQRQYRALQNLRASLGDDES